MIFKVSDDFKGSCVLPTLDRAIWAGVVLSISGNNLNAGDVQDAITKGILVSVDNKYKQEDQKDHDVVIINNTNRLLTLNGRIWQAKGSLPVSKDEADDPVIKAAASNGFITIVSDEGDEKYIRRKNSKKTTKKKTTKKKVVAKNTKKKVVKVKSDYVVPKTGADREVIPKAWNFRTGKIEDAQTIPKAEDPVIVDDSPEIEFVDGKKTTKKKKTSRKKTTKKKTSRKSASKKTKKKVIGTKKRKVKVLEPVGEKRLPKTVADAAIELDSRGNPIGDKPSDTLKHLIDDLNAPEDVSFADDEQALHRYNDRTDID